MTVLAVAPGTGTIYAGTASSGLFRSTDGGATWRPLQKGPGGGEVLALSLVASQPSTIHAAVNNLAWRSDDGGDTWTRSSFPLHTSSLAVAPSNPQVVYASDGFSVLASGDGGASVHHAAPLSRLFVIISALAVSPLSATEVYALTDHGLFKTSDGGSTWAPLSLSKVAIALAIDPFDPATLYAGTGDGSFFTSHDRGATWAPAASGLGTGSVDVVAPDPATRGTLYAGVNAGSASGIWKSVDSGATWTLAVATDQVDALAAAPVPAGRLLAGLQPSGILKTEDAGATWAAANQGLSGTLVLAAAADPFAAGTLYAAVYTHNLNNFDVTGIDDQALPLGLLRSRDGGATWEHADAGLDTSFITKLLADPRSPGRLYAVSNASIFSSADAGDSWQATAGDPGIVEVLDLALDPKRSGSLYLIGVKSVLGRGVVEVERSTNGGASWTSLALPGGGAPPALVTVAVDPVRPARVYLGGSVLLKSFHRGDGLTQIGSGFPRDFVEKLLVDPVAPSDVYAFTVSRSLLFSFFRSLDGGVTWTRASAGLPPRRFALFDLAADPATATLFLSSQLGIFVSSGGGASWQSASNGLLGASGGLLLADPLHSGTVLTAPELGGLWTYTLAP